MKLLLLQTDIRWLAPDDNRRRAEELIAQSLGASGASGASDPSEPSGSSGASGTSETSEPSGASGTSGTSGVDLIVLPEMFTTGFAVDPAGAAEPGGVETLAWMRAIAARYDAAVVGSVAVSESGEETGERYFNRLFFVKPDGSATRYDKRHLFSFAGEHLRYTSGNERVVVEWRGLRILLQVCYDLRFPVFARNRGGNCISNGNGTCNSTGTCNGNGTGTGNSISTGTPNERPDYDMMLCVANWPTVRIHPWNTLLRARAIENVSYAVGVNRTGADPFATYSGGTALIDFRGETLAAAAPGTEQAVLCEVSPEALRAFRAKFPALSDADDFTLTIKQINER